MSILLLLGVFVVTNTAGVLILRTTLEGGGGLRGLLGQVADPLFLLGVVAYAASFITWLFALQRFAVSVVYPVFVGAGYAAIVAASWVILREEFSVLHVVGILVIGLGILMIVL